LIAGLIEEGFKFRAFKWLIYDNNEFDEPYDGILYAVMISLGFAAFENILYVALWTFKLGSLGTYQIGVSRAMFAVPAHAFFGAIMGYYFGLAKFSGNKDAKRMFILKALGYPILAHGLYDFFLFTRTAAGALYMLALFIFCWSFVLKAVKMQVGKSPFKDL
jgi:RsiW-degrading membrane proteinase PrsW (M82 family)